MSLDTRRTVLANFIVQHPHRPRPLVLAAWLWLAAEADDLEEKRRCLWAEFIPDAPSYYSPTA